MKSKFGVILLCAAIVMSLCACKPLNISGDGNGSSNGNNSASGAVSVGFIVEEAGSAPEGAISISTPVPDDIINGDVIFQYKAIPGSSSAKEIVGATGDKWTELPSVFTGLGEKFTMDFSAGEWTFDLQGVDKEDKTTLKYQLAEPVKKTITSDFKDTIKLQIEALNAGDGGSVGTIQVDITGQGSKLSSPLEIYFYSLEDDEYDYEEYNYEDEGYDYRAPALRSAVKAEVAQSPIELSPTGTGSGDNAYETYFKGSYQLPSGTYEMYFYLSPNERGSAATELYIEDVIVVGGKTTIISGLIPLESEFLTRFLDQSSSNKRKFEAHFFRTAEAHSYTEAMKIHPYKWSKDEINKQGPDAYKPEVEAPKERHIVFDLGYYVKADQGITDKNQYFLVLNGEEVNLAQYETAILDVGKRYAIPENLFGNKLEQNAIIRVYPPKEEKQVVIGESKEIALGFIDLPVK